MRIRYSSYLSLGVAAAFLVVATYAFSLSTIATLSLGVGVAMLAVSLGVAARYRNDLPTLVVSGAIAVVSAWIVVASQVFAQSTVSDLTFASAIAVGALAAIGLTANEVDTERVVHKLEVHEGQGEHRAAA
jgi:FtsH-binding integral membrane protein